MFFGSCHAIFPNDTMSFGSCRSIANTGEAYRKKKIAIIEKTNSGDQSTKQ